MLSIPVNIIIIMIIKLLLLPSLSLSLTINIYNCYPLSTSLTDQQQSFDKLFQLVKQLTCNCYQKLATSQNYQQFNPKINHLNNCPIVNKNFNYSFNCYNDTIDSKLVNELLKLIKINDNDLLVLINSIKSKINSSNVTIVDDNDIVTNLNHINNNEMFKVNYNTVINKTKRLSNGLTINRLSTISKKSILLNYLITLIITNHKSTSTKQLTIIIKPIEIDSETSLIGWKQLKLIFISIAIIFILILIVIKFFITKNQINFKSIFLPRFKYFNRHEAIMINGNMVNIETIRESHCLATFKGEKVFLKKLNLNPMEQRDYNLFGQMISLRNLNLVDFKGLYRLQSTYNNNDDDDDFKDKVNPNPNCERISNYYLVWEYCDRGNLMEIIKTKSIDFDWPFKLSLLLDLSNGLKYLHSTIGAHGWLTSVNCVIDNKWLLKITNFGLIPLYQLHDKNPDTSVIYQPTSCQLLWSPPEVIKFFIINNHQQSTTDVNNHNGKRWSSSRYYSGSKEADIYSLAIIMSELINQSTPFGIEFDYDNNNNNCEGQSADVITAESIISSISSGIYLRPTVDPSNIPQVIINLMENCWSDNPDYRPSINEVYDLFLTHSEGKTIIDSMIRKLEKYTINLEAIVTSRTIKLEEEMKKTDTLLYRMLPVPVADALKMGEIIEPDKFEEVTVYFSDIVGFTTISAYSKPIEIISLLNDLYTSFDRIIDSFKVYKVETIGDAYMVVSGVPERRSDHAEQIANMALDILHSCTQIKIAHLPGVPLKIRIGINTGPVVAGVVGTTMPRYCLFGNTVNTASRIESTGRAYQIHISKRTERHLRASKQGYHIKYRGEIDLKGRGKMATYWLTGRDGFDKILPEPEDDEVTNHGFSDGDIIEIFGSTNKTSSDASPSTPTGSTPPFDCMSNNNRSPSIHLHPHHQNHSTRNVLQVPK